MVGTSKWAMQCKAVHLPLVHLVGSPAFALQANKLSVRRAEALQAVPLLDLILLMSTTVIRPLGRPASKHLQVNQHKCTFHAPTSNEFLRPVGAASSARCVRLRERPLSILSRRLLVAGRPAASGGKVPGGEE